MEDLPLLFVKTLLLRPYVFTFLAAFLVIGPRTVRLAERERPFSSPVGSRLFFADSHRHA